MRVFVKICGLRSADMVKAAVDAGADAVGFVLADSPRRVTPAQAAALADAVPPGILRVAVLRHPRPAEWQAVVDQVRPDWIQTDVADLEKLPRPAGIGILPVYRDIPGLDTGALAREDRALFEAAASGEGISPDWARARQLSGTTNLVLAGGLDAANVGRAIVQVRPWGVDVSSGVETSRGVKDPERIRAFIKAVRRAEQEMESADQ